MATDVAVLRTVLEGDASDFDQKVKHVEDVMASLASREWSAGRVDVDVASGMANVARLQEALRSLQAESLNINIGVNGGPGGSGGGSFGGNPERIAAATQAKVQQILQVSQERQAAILREGQAGADAVLEQSGARQTSIQQESQARQEASAQQHAQRMAQIAEESSARQSEAEAKTWAQRASSAGESLAGSGYRQMRTGAILSATVTAPAVELGKYVMDTTGDFQAAMLQATTMTNLGVENIDKYSQAVLKLSQDPNIKNTPTELADALLIAGSKTKSGADAMEVLRVSAIGATAGLGEVKDVVSSVSTVLNAYKMPVSDAARVTDILVNTAKQGGVEAAQFAMAFPKVVEAAAGAHVPIEQVAASIATMTRVGIPAGTAATALQRLLLNFEKPSQQAQKAVAGLGETFEDLREKMRTEGFESMLEGLFAKVGDGDDAEAKLAPIFGSVNALKAAMSTAGDQAQEYRTILESFSGINGISLSAAAGQMEGANAEFAKLKATTDAAAISIGERLMPALTSLAREAGQEIPQALDAAIKAWDALSPPEQKAIEGFAGMLVALGPLTMMAANVKILGGALLEMAAIPMEGMGIIKLVDGLGALFTAMKAIQAAGGIGALFSGGLAGLGTVELGGAALALSGLVVTAGLLGLAWEALGTETYKIQAAMDEADTAAYNLQTQLDTMQRSIKDALQFSGASAGAQKAIADLGDKAAAAKDNTAELLKVLKAASDEKAKIALDPNIDDNSKALVENSLTQFIHELETHVVTLDVTLRQQADIAGGDNPGVPTPEENRRKLEQRAKAAGVTLPDVPMVPDSNQDQGSDWNPLDPEQPMSMVPNPTDPDYLTNMQEAYAAIEKYEAAQHKAAGATKEVAAAINEQTAAFDKLNPAQLAEERARLKKLQGEGHPDINRMRELAEYNKANRAADWLKDQKPDDGASGLGNQAADNETAQRLLGDQIKSVEAAIRAWQQLGSTVQGMGEKLNTVDESAGNKNELAMQAKIAEGAFAGIPPHLLDILTGVAAINDQMERMTGTRDRLRTIFSDMYKDVIKVGADPSFVEGAAAQASKELNYSGRMNALWNTGQWGVNTVYNASAAQQNSLQSQQEALQAASKKSADAYAGTPSGPIGEAIAKAAQAKQEAGTAEYAHLCERLLRETVQGITPEFNKIFAGAATAAQAMERFKAAGVGVPYTGQALSPGDLLYAGREAGAGAGHAMAVGPDGKFLDQYGSHNAPTVWPDWVVSPDALDPNTPAGQRVASTPIIDTNRVQPRRTPWEPDFNGDLLQGKLPIGWGKEFSSMDLAPGESGEAREEVQDSFLDEKQVAKWKADAAKKGVAYDDYATALRAVANRVDYVVSVQKATHAAETKLKATLRESALAGKNDDISALLFDQSQDLYTPQSDKNEAIAGAVGGAQSSADAESAKFVKGEQEKAAALSAGASLLQGSAVNMATYTRAIAQANAEMEAHGRYLREFNTADALAAAGHTSLAAQVYTAAQGHVQADVAATMGKYDAGQTADAQTGIGKRTEQDNQENDLLDFEAGLIAKGMANATKRKEIVEQEKAYRETLKSLMDAAHVTTPTADMLAQADDAANQVQIGQFGRDQISSFDSDTQAAKEHAARMAELGIDALPQNDLAGRRNAASDAESAKLAADPGLTTEQQKARLAFYMDEYDAEERNKEAEEERSKIHDYQNQALETQKQMQLELATTAQQRLSIELAYQDALRALPDAKPETSGEKAARESTEAAQRAGASQQDSLQRLRAVGADFESIIDDAMNKGLQSGWRKFEEDLKDEALSEVSSFLTNSLLGKGATDKKQGGLLDEGQGIFNSLFGHHAKAHPAAPEKLTFPAVDPSRPDTTSNFLGTAGTYFDKFHNPLGPGTLSQTGLAPTSALGANAGANPIETALAGKTINVGTLNITSPSTKITSASTTVTGGTASSLGGLGSLSAPSGEQSIGNFFGPGASGAGAIGPQGM